MPNAIQSNWLTSVRLQRIAQALRVLPSGSPGLPIDEAIRAVWANCGGPHDEVRLLLEVLVGIGLITLQDASARRNRAGDRIAKAIKNGDLRPLGMTFIRAACFHDQARILVECGSSDGDGNLVCPTRAARTGAPQLLGMLQWWEGVQILPSVVVPKHLLTELNTVWALLPPPTQVPAWALERKAVGDRAEMYSLQRERTKVIDPSKVHWVARDSDSLGWDIEDRSHEPRRCIEVKGRRDHEVLFFLSDNEWSKAREVGERYEIHFWGGIDLGRDPAVEYAELTAAGYPLVIQDPSAEIGNGTWEAAAVTWRVTRKGPISSGRGD